MLDIMFDLLDAVLEIAITINVFVLRLSYVR